MFGQEVLTKKEQKHLRENKIRTKYDMQKQVEHIKAFKRDYPDNTFVCYECVAIARKLGMWEV